MMLSTTSITKMLTRREGMMARLMVRNADGRE
jgi:hypothetical protein